jgi:hypothetical protein
MDKEIQIYCTFNADPIEFVVNACSALSKNSPSLFVVNFYARDFFLKITILQYDAFEKKTLILAVAFEYRKYSKATVYHAKKYRQYSSLH